MKIQSRQPNPNATRIGQPTKTNRGKAAKVINLAELCPTNRSPHLHVTYRDEDGNTGSRCQSLQFEN